MRVIIITHVILILILSCGTEVNASCNDKVIEAIKIDFDNSYKQYKVFWNTLNCYNNAAVKGDSNAITEIISLYGIGSHNSEYTEWYAETIEAIFLKSPQKLFDALLDKDKKTIDGIMFYLENPIDGEKEAIIIIAKKISKKSKYRLLANRLINSSR